MPTALPWAVTQKWTATTPLRIAEDRRQALVEIDALVALMLGVTADQLCTIYRTQFAVLYGYDHHDYVYDANGRLVPNEVLTVWRKKGDRIRARGADRDQSGREHVHLRASVYACSTGRADMRSAYAEFERRLAAYERAAAHRPGGEIQDGLLDYLTTTFALADPDAQLALAEFLSDREHGIFKGPLPAAPAAVPAGGGRVAVAPWAGTSASPLTGTRRRRSPG